MNRNERRKAGVSSANKTIEQNQVEIKHAFFDAKAIGLGFLTINRLGEMARIEPSEVVKAAQKLSPSSQSPSQK